MFLIYGTSLEFHAVPFNQKLPPIFHWPLGVAAYRGFPKVKIAPVLANPVNKKRKHLCNFLGTVYENSVDRKLVVAILTDANNTHWNSYLKYRYEWTPNETKDSVAEYIEVLQNSDFTLSPPGNNMESFRIYEAMSFGSIPVLQREAINSDTGLQGKNYKCQYSYEILKDAHAPVVWLDDWHELPTLMEEFSQAEPKIIYEKR
jgi:hypothetical protein